MRILTVVAVVGLLTLAVGTPSLRAERAQDMDAFAKWSAAEDVHYDVTAEYAGTTPILAIGGPVDALVQDRFELSFDWNAQEMKLLGKPTFKNFPSTVPTAAELFAKACQVPPPFRGSYDHLEVVDVKQLGLQQLELTGKRTYPEGSVPAVIATEGCKLHPSAAKTETVTLKLDVYPGTLLALQTSGGTVTVLKDGKTLIAKEPDGWTRTYTLKIVK